MLHCVSALTGVEELLCRSNAVPYRLIAQLSVVERRHIEAVYFPMRCACIVKRKGSERLWCSCSTKDGW